MAHPYHSKRDDKASRSRAKELTKGYASGGGVHSDEKMDKALVKKMVRSTALKMDGGGAKARMDRPGRASGGRVKKAPQTNIHINVTPPSGSPPLAGLGAPAGIPVSKPASPPPPGPPMAGPGMPPGPMGAGPGGPPGMPPGMPPMPRAKGGRVGKGWTDSMKNETKVQHTPNISSKGLGRGKPITYKTGGPISSPAKGGMGPKMPGGGRGGLGRLAKAHRAAKKH